MTRKSPCSRQYWPRQCCAHRLLESLVGLFVAFFGQGGLCAGKQRLADEFQIFARPFVSWLFCSCPNLFQMDKAGHEPGPGRLGMAGRLNQPGVAHLLLQAQ